eukprot:Tbor_TRINITY_DN2518_c0_g1::TRINITY_DN2518_c0_g1_i1::g.435::m.435
MSHQKHGFDDKGGEGETINIDKSMYNKRFKHVRGERRVVQEDGSIMLKADERKSRDDERKKEAWEKVLIKHEHSIPKLEDELSQMERASFLSGQQKERRQYVKRLVHALKERQRCKAADDGIVPGAKRPQREMGADEDGELSMYHHDIDRGQLSSMLEDLDAVYKGSSHVRPLPSYPAEEGGCLMSSSPAVIMAALADDSDKGGVWASALTLSMTTPLHPNDQSQSKAQIVPNPLQHSKTVVSWEASTVSKVPTCSRMVPRSVQLKRRKEEDSIGDSGSSAISREALPVANECGRSVSNRADDHSPIGRTDSIKCVVGDLGDEDIDALLADL